MVHGWSKAPHERESPNCEETRLWVFHVMVQFEFGRGVMG